MHLMIDLETLDTADTAVITQIGYASFDPVGNDCIESGVFYLNVEDQLKLGRTMSWATISWWFRQNEAARLMMVKYTQGDSSKEQLREFGEKFSWPSVEGVWGNGCNFDIVLLDSLFKSVGFTSPWNFRAVRDCRTLFDLIKVPRHANEIPHSSEHDAIAQALQVQDCYRLLEEWKTR